MSRASSSTRWCPTPEQLMILEETYRSGVRTPNSSQIQHITAHLSFYGKIEGKNVFYWFQNHKARERQKLRRKLGKQLQHQPHYQHQNQLQHHLHYIDHPSPSSSNHQQVSYSNSPIFPSQERGELSEEGSSATSNYTWKLMNIPGSFEYGRHWMTMVNVVASTSPCHSRPPLKTLQLFPTNESCNASKQ